MQALWASPESGSDGLLGRQGDLSGEQLQALARLDATYWRVLRWHGMFAVHFQFRQPSTASPSLIADVLALRFAILHELAHLISRQDGYIADSVSVELEADVMAAHMLRYSVGPEMAALGAALYIYAARRVTEALFLVPPNTHPHWLCRQSEIEIALGWNLHPRVRSAIEPVNLLHEFASMNLGGALTARPPMGDCFDVWGAVIAEPIDARIEEMVRLEQLDTAFHTAPFLGYAVAAREQLLEQGKTTPPLSQTDPAEIAHLVKSGRGSLRNWLRDRPQLLQTGTGITYRSLTCPEEGMSDLLRGVRARYAANRMGIAPGATDW